MKWFLLLPVFLAGTSFAQADNHPALFLKKGKVIATDEFDGKALPENCTLRGESKAKLQDGVMTITNNVKGEAQGNARPVLHYKGVADEFICHMRIRFDGKSYKPKNPWLDVGSQHRNHFNFNDKEVSFSSEASQLKDRKKKIIRKGNMLPLNKWLYVTIELSRGKLGLSINGKTQIYEDPNIEIGKWTPKIGIKAICDAAFHVDYIRVWKVAK